MNGTAMELLEPEELLVDWFAGPSVIRPMIQLISLMDAGAPMRVRQADYNDPGRWWL